MGHYMYENEDYTATIDKENDTNLVGNIRNIIRGMIKFGRKDRSSIQEVCDALKMCYRSKDILILDAFASGPEVWLNTLDDWIVLNNTPETYNELHGVSLCAVQGGFICVGGRLEIGRDALHIGLVYHFSIVDKKWTRMRDMPTARDGVSAVEIEKKLFVFGGISGGNDETFVSACEKLDMVENVWKTRASLPVPMDKPFVQKVSKKIYVLFHGDFDLAGSIDVMFCYDPQGDIYQPIELPEYISSTWLSPMVSAS